MTEVTTIDLKAVREELGRKWGLERALTKVEMARALRMGPDMMSSVERGKTRLSGPALALIEAFQDGYPPRNMKDLITPGYPRGAKW